MHDRSRRLATRLLLGASCCVVGALFSSQARGLDPAREIQQYVHDVWQIPEGLPQSSVFSIAQTRDGYIWLGTEEGLVRFDGVRLTVFDRSNTEELRSKVVSALLAGRDGSLWIGTSGGGLTRFHGNWTTYTTQNGLLNDHVVSILEDREGSVWIGFAESGVNRLKNGRLTTYGVRNGAPDGPVVTMCEDREGNLWLGSRGGGLARFRDGKFTTYTRRDGLPSDAVRSIHEDRDGGLWIGTDAGGLTELKGGNFTTEPIGMGDLRSVALRIVEDRDGSLWVGTRGDGVRRRSHGKWEAYRKVNGLSDDSVRSLVEDREGNLWVGTLNGGVNRLANGKFTTFGKSEGLSDDSVLSVFEDREGRIWIGTDKGGLNKLEDGGVTVYRKGPGLPADSVSSIREDREGTLWLGTSRGLSCLKNGRFIHYGAREGLPENSILSIYADRQGGTWIGSFDSGLYRWKDGRVTSYSKKDGLTSNYIVSLLEDHDGVLWVGTAGGGMNRLENGRFAPEPHSDRLSRNFIEGFYEDRQGSLWIGTAGGGLGRLKAGRLTVYGKKDGLFDDSVFQILEDDDGYLWMGCNRGISRVRKRDIDDFDAGKIRSIPHEAYGRADGLRNGECNGLGQPSGWRSKDGRLWFATQAGVAVIDPAHTPSNPLVPPVLIEEVLVDDRPVDRRRAARLSPDPRRLEIHYTALSFVAPSKVRFRYRLEDFDKEWIDAGTRRVAYYTNLPPGAHRFRVIASNNDGIWNNAGASWDFEILPKFYETWRFAVLVAVGAIAAGWGLHRLHVRQVKAGFRAVLAERGRLAREIHDTLAQGFAGISIHLESVAETLDGAPTTARQHLDRARGLVRTSLAEARRSVSDLRALALEKSNVVEALRNLADQLTAGTGVATAIEVEGELRELPPAVEHNLLRIGQEALINAIKYAEAQRITVRLTFDRGRVRLSVRDDGRGFDSAEILTDGDGHFGLLGMRERIAQSAGELTIESTPGKGTEIVVLLPVT